MRNNRTWKKVKNMPLLPAGSDSECSPWFGYKCSAYKKALNHGEHGGHGEVHIDIHLALYNHPCTPCTPCSPWQRFFNLSTH
jgi:hypothetical protein